MRRLYALLPLLLFSRSVAAQEFDTIRICTYHLPYFDTNSSRQIDALKLVLNTIKPDVLLIQGIAEVYENRRVTVLLMDLVLQRLDVPLGLENISQPGAPQVYTSGRKVKVLGGESIKDYEDNFYGYWVRRSVDNREVFGDSILLISADLIAGETTNAVKERSRIADVLYEYILNLGGPPLNIDKVVIAGSLNLYSSSEPGYHKLTFAGPLIDPIDRPGEWHDNEEFADLHTHDNYVWTTSQGRFGGLKDRFDYIMLTWSLFTYNYLHNSYTTFGNDGQHFNDSINALPNLAVGPVMAQALLNASDHLPVYLDLVFPRPTTDVIEAGKDYRLDLSEE